MASYVSFYRETSLLPYFKQDGNTLCLHSHFSLWHIARCSLLVFMLSVNSALNDSHETFTAFKLKQEMLRSLSTRHVNIVS